MTLPRRCAAVPTKRKAETITYQPTHQTGWLRMARLQLASMLLVFTGSVCHASEVTFNLPTSTLDFPAMRVGDTLFHVVMRLEDGCFQPVSIEPATAQYSGADYDPATASPITDGSLP